MRIGVFSQAATLPIATLEDVISEAVACEHFADGFAIVGVLGGFVDFHVVAPTG